MTEVQLSGSEEQHLVVGHGTIESIVTYGRKVSGKKKSMLTPFFFFFLRFPNCDSCILSYNTDAQEVLFKKCS